MTNSLITRLKPLITVVVVGILIANLWLFRSYSDAVAAQKMTQSELAAVQLQVQQLGAPADLGEITRLLGEAQAQIKEREKYFPTDPGAFDLLFSLSRAAAESGVTIAQLRAEPMGEEKMTLEYWATRYYLEVIGSSGGLTGFVERVEKLPQVTLMLDNLVLKPAGAQWTLSFQAVALSRERPKAIGSGPAAPPIRLQTTPLPRP